MRSFTFVTMAIAFLTLCITGVQAGGFAKSCINTRIFNGATLYLLSNCYWNSNTVDIPGGTRNTQLYLNYCLGNLDGRLIASHSPFLLLSMLTFSFLPFCLPWHTVLTFTCSSLAPFFTSTNSLPSLPPPPSFYIISNTNMHFIHPSKPIIITELHAYLQPPLFPTHLYPPVRASWKLPRQLQRQPGCDGINPISDFHLSFRRRWILGSSAWLENCPALLELVYR